MSKTVHYACDRCKRTATENEQAQLRYLHTVEVFKRTGVTDIQHVPEDFRFLKMDLCSKCRNVLTKVMTDLLDQFNSSGPVPPFDAVPPNPNKFSSDVDAALAELQEGDDGKVQPSEDEDSSTDA